MAMKSCLLMMSNLLIMSKYQSQRLVLALLISSATVLASAVCDTLLVTGNIPQYRPGSIEYTTEQSHYWSTSASALLPACILAPNSAQEVASIVQVLLNTTEKFAIKSGGHNPNNYFASIDNGPLISTLNLKDVILDAQAQTVKIGPGSRWDEVAATLDGTNYTVVGCRIGNVGVGGYMLGGKSVP